MNRICGVLALMTALGLPAPAAADWLLAPIAGITVRTATGFVDLDSTVANRHPVFGVSLTGLSSGLFGLEFEAAIVPSVFTGHDLVDSSRVVATSASVVVAVPRRLMRIRPGTAVVGVGLVFARPVRMRPTCYRSTARSRRCSSVPASGCRSRGASPCART